MKQYEKEVLQAQIDNEKAVLKRLEENYEDALAEINDKIAILLGRQDSDQQYVIYQVEFQKSLKKQIEAILETLHSNEFESISEYLTKSYNEGFLGTMYSLQNQGIPLAMPIDQAQVVAAVMHETKLSESLYASLGKDVVDLRKKIAGEISRGISTGMMYSEISRNISSWARIPKNNAMRIARTEGHRIQERATMDAHIKAKDKGAEVMKVWSAALDSRTRDTHMKIDGEIREVEEVFSNGLLYPGDPRGRAEEVINCRCRCNSKGRWLLDANETKDLGNVEEMSDKQKEIIAGKLNVPVDELHLYSEQIVPINAKNYKDFKEKYDEIWHYEGSELQKEAEARIAGYKKKGKASEQVRSGAQKMNDAKVLENNGKSGIIELEDIVIHKSVGAKVKNYDIIAPDTGEIYHFAEGTKIQNSEVFAGKGTKHPLHEGVAEGLTEQYGGTPEKWQHCKGHGVIDFDGEERKAEVHWFQEETVGRVKFKVKEWEDED